MAELIFNGRFASQGPKVKEISSAIFAENAAELFHSALELRCIKSTG